MPALGEGGRGGGGKRIRRRDKRSLFRWRTKEGRKKRKGGVWEKEIWASDGRKGRDWPKGAGNTLKWTG